MLSEWLQGKHAPGSFPFAAQEQGAIVCAAPPSLITPHPPLSAAAFVFLCQTFGIFLYPCCFSLAPGPAGVELLVPLHKLPAPSASGGRAASSPGSTCPHLRGSCSLSADWVKIPSSATFSFPFVFQVSVFLGCDLISRLGPPLCPFGCISRHTDTI